MHQVFNQHGIEFRLQFRWCALSSRVLYFDYIPVTLYDGLPTTGTAKNGIAGFMLMHDNDRRSTDRAILYRYARLAMSDNPIKITLAAKGNEPFTKRRIELFAEQTVNNIQGLFDRHAPAIGPGTCHGIEGIT